MARNMSFMLTTEQIKNKTKTVTRRIGWWFLKPGDILNACEKCQGLKKGEKVKKICQIGVVSVRTDWLKAIDSNELKLEGFPSMTVADFIDMFCKHNKCRPGSIVNRIEFMYL